MSVERAETDAGNVKEAEAFQLSEEMKRGLYNWLRQKFPRTCVSNQCLNQAPKV